MARLNVSVCNILIIALSLVSLRYVGTWLQMKGIRPLDWIGPAVPSAPH